MIDLNTLTIAKARVALDRKEFSAVDLAKAYLAEIEKKNEELNAYLEIYDDVLEQAKAADDRIAKGESYPMLGIPLAIKDNILIEGRKVSAASKMLENYVASYNATVIEKLKNMGAVFLGRTNMDEFALGGSTENSAFGVTKNPLDKNRVAGGTSGGSAVAVVANMALGALGTDTGGSVRNPASFCGVVGLKPTYGAVSRSGLIAAVSSFDQAGPIAKTVEDVKLIFDAIRGKNSLDSTSIDDNLYKKVKEKKIIGVPMNSFSDALQKDVLKKFTDALEYLEKQGYTINYGLEFPSAKPSLSAYYIINFAEVSTNLARFDGIRYGLHINGKNLIEDYLLAKGKGFGKETRRRILLGTYVLSAGYYDAYYGKAITARKQLQQEYSKAFEIVDFIVTPTMPDTAMKIGEKSDPLSLYLEDVFTVTANLTGNPAISIPMGTVDREGKKLPLGIQFMASHGREDLLFEVGKKFEAMV
jgi:aspartyl-tRNA(Asn)/glutamyl-tRNA(Gln) amidotransferase subunit A